MERGFFCAKKVPLKVRSFLLVLLMGINEIVKFGVMSTPALVVDGQVKVSGRVPSPEDIKNLLA